MSLAKTLPPLALETDRTDIAAAHAPTFTAMSTAKGPLQVLIVEDSENDAELLDLELQRAGYDTAFRRVETTTGMEAALDDQRWDVVVADYVLPHFSGIDALSLVKQRGIDLPFIIVSGHITEDTAVAAMKAGAHDYVMKDNLTRLGPAVDRELREAEVRRQRRRTEESVKVEHAITRILANAESIEEAAPGIIQLLLDGLRLELGTFWLVDPRHQVLHPLVISLRQHNPRLQSFLEERRRVSLAPGIGLPGRVWRERRASSVRDLALDRDFQQREAAEHAELRSAMAFPLQSASEFFGVIEFFTVREMEHDPALLNMMTAIGSEIGQFINRRRAEEALRKAHDELEMRVTQRTAELHAAHEKLKGAIAERKRLEHELLEITEKERRRIGLDLHDDLGQKLSGIALMMKGLENRLLKAGAREAEDAGKIHGLVQQTMSHASDLAHDLATLDVKEGDLVAALTDLCAHARELFGIICKFTSQGDIPIFEKAVINQLYKIVQESVTNAIKHGKAKKVAITLVREGNVVRLTIQNDGMPFPDLKGKSMGMGLRIMSYRASIINAELDVKGTGNSGTKVTCVLPIETKR
jgi:signal transduction histidine kinase/FixJ family two-component response regulator